MNAKKKWSWLAILVGTFASLAAVADQLPADWYRLPEDASNLATRVDSSSDNRGFLFLDRSLDRIFSAQAEALDKLKEMKSPSHAAAGQPPDVTDWRLVSLLTEIGVSVQGVIAPVALKGTADVKVFWRKKKAQEDRVAMAPPGSEPAEVSIGPGSSWEDMKAQMEPMIAVAKSVEKIKDEATFRKNLYDSASTFYELAHSLDNAPDCDWWVSRFRLDLWVNASGTVHPGVKVGGELKLRFEWHRLQKKATMVARDDGDSTDLQKKFKKFVTDLAEDAQSVSFETFKSTGFYPSYIRPGIGFNAAGDIGVVKIGGGLYGFLYFSTDATPPPWPSRESKSNAPVPILEHNPTRAHLAYAKAQGIPYQLTGRGPLEDVIYKLDRRRFRKGLARAVKMSMHFADRAAQVHIGQWRIYEIRPFFELSIGGDFKFVTLAGTGSVEMGFFNGKF